MSNVVFSILFCFFFFFQAEDGIRVLVRSRGLGDVYKRQGSTLFRRVGRRLEMTEAGERILGHADEIFALGDLSLIHI